jgi:predicted MFS family arabinose efflux permease
MDNRALKKRFWMVSSTHMFIEVFLLMHLTLLPVFVDEFQLSLLEASLLVSIQSVVGLVMNVPAGVIADRVNAKMLLMVSLIIEGSSALLISQAHQYWMLVLGVALMRIASPVYHISGLSQISKLATREQISSLMGTHNALGSVGAAVGSLSLSISLATIGWRTVYLSWALPILLWVGVLFHAFPIDDTSAVKQPLSRSRSIQLTRIFNRNFIVFLTSIGVREIGVTSIVTFLTTYLITVRGVSQSLASLIFGLGPVVGIVASLTGGYMGDRFGAKRILSSALVGNCIFLILLAFATDIPSLAVLYMIYSYWNNSVWTPMNTLVARIVPTAERGSGFSTYFFIEGVVKAVTPFLAAAVIETYNIWTLFPFSFCFVLASIIILQLLKESSAH